MNEIEILGRIQAELDKRYLLLLNHTEEQPFSHGNNIVLLSDVIRIMMTDFGVSCLKK